MTKNISRHRTPTAVVGHQHEATPTRLDSKTKICDAFQHFQVRLGNCSMLKSYTLSLDTDNLFCVSVKCTNYKLFLPLYSALSACQYASHIIYQQLCT